MKKEIPSIDDIKALLDVTREKVIKFEELEDRYIFESNTSSRTTIKVDNSGTSLFNGIIKMSSLIDFITVLYPIKISTENIIPFLEKFAPQSIKFLEDYKVEYIDWIVQLGFNTSEFKGIHDERIDCLKKVIESFNDSRSQVLFSILGLCRDIFLLGETKTPNGIRCQYIADALNKISENKIITIKDIEENYSKNTHRFINHHEFGYHHEEITFMGDITLCKVDSSWQYFTCPEIRLLNSILHILMP